MQYHYCSLDGGRVPVTELVTMVMIFPIVSSVNKPLGQMADLELFQLTSSRLIQLFFEHK